MCSSASVGDRLFSAGVQVTRAQGCHRQRPRLYLFLRKRPYFQPTRILAARPVSAPRRTRICTTPAPDCCSDSELLCASALYQDICPSDSAEAQAECGLPDLRMDDVGCNNHGRREATGAENPSTAGSVPDPIFRLTTLTIEALGIVDCQGSGDYSGRRRWRSGGPAELGPANACAGY